MKVLNPFYSVRVRLRTCSYHLWPPRMMFINTNHNHMCTKYLMQKYKIETIPASPRHNLQNEEDDKLTVIAVASFNCTLKEMT